VGGVAVLRARLGVGRAPQPEHVQPDRARHGCRLLYSLFATFAPGLFPAGFRGMGGTVAVYFEAAAVITVLVLLGQVLELRAREQTGGAIRALLKLAPKTARRLKAGGEDEEVGA
jgi:P-type Cu+ transporter